jgi:hypothetical protein
MYRFSERRIRRRKSRRKREFAVCMLVERHEGIGGWRVGCRPEEQAEWVRKE